MKLCGNGASARQAPSVAEIDPAERQRILDEQSPVKAKWGYYPK